MNKKKRAYLNLKKNQILKNQRRFQSKLKKFQLNKKNLKNNFTQDEGKNLSCANTLKYTLSGNIKNKL